MRDQLTDGEDVGWFKNPPETVATTASHADSAQMALRSLARPDMTSVGSGPCGPSQHAQVKRDGRFEIETLLRLGMNNTRGPRRSPVRIPPIAARHFTPTMGRGCTSLRGVAEERCDSVA